MLRERVEYIKMLVIHLVIWSLHLRLEKKCISILLLSIRIKICNLINCKSLKFCKNYCMKTSYKSTTWLKTFLDTMLTMMGLSPMTSLSILVWSNISDRLLFKDYIKRIFMRKEN